MRASSFAFAFLFDLLSFAPSKADFLSAACLIVNSYNFWASDLVGSCGLTLAPGDNIPYRSPALKPPVPA